MDERLQDLLDALLYIQQRYTDDIRNAPHYERVLELIEMRRKEERQIIERNGLFKS